MSKIKTIFLIIVFFFISVNVFSNNNLFFFFYIIIFNENNKIKAELLDYAFKKGFEKLIKKILLNEDVNNILKTNSSDIKKFIESYQIIENNNPLNKKEVIVNISFDRAKLNSFFYKKNISYADISKTKLIIYPLLIKNDELFLFSNNYFYKNWNININTENDYIEYILPIENLEDVELFRKNSSNLENLEVKKILSNYNVDNYIFVIIEADRKEVKVFIKGLVSENNVSKNVKLGELLNEDVNSQNLIITEIKNQIHEIWKQQNLIDVRTPSFLNITLDINNKTDLLKLREALKKIDLIESHNVLELNRNYAKIKIKYFGKINKLKIKFNENGITTNIFNDQWKLKLI